MLASFMLDQVLLIHGTLPLHESGIICPEKIREKISQVQLSGMADLDQMRSLRYGVSKQAAAAKPTIFPPSALDVLRRSSQRLRCGYCPCLPRAYPVSFTAILPRALCH